MSSALRRRAVLAIAAPSTPHGIIAAIGCDYFFAQFDEEVAIQASFLDLGFGARLARLACYECGAGFIYWTCVARTLELAELLQSPTAFVFSIGSLPIIFEKLR